MKSNLLAIAVAVALGSLSACSKPNNVPLLEDQLHALAKQEDAKVAAFDRRGAAILRELAGRTLPGDVKHALDEAHDAVSGLRQWDAQLGPTTANLVKDGKGDELQKLVYETQEKQDKLDTIAEDDLTAVEGWIARSEVATAVPPPPAAPVPPDDVPPPAPAPAVAPTPTPAHP
ncbi:MAG TPA: hypothetical protein VMJ10_14050 [Kofleriaceae bacterium]|nr:hypothetical protein [Kofleriaceae bacterium]